MARTTKTEGGKPGPHWLSRTEAAAALAVSVGHFDRDYRPLFSASSEKTIGGRPWFRFRNLIDVLVKRSAPDPVADDPMLAVADGESPALEEFRRHRAGQEGIKLAEMKKAAVRLDVLREAVRPGLEVMRDAGQKIERDFGSVAGEMYNEAFTEFEEAIVRSLGE